MKEQYELLEFLIRKAIVAEDQAGRILQLAGEAGTAVEKVVLELGLSNEEDLYRACANFKGLGFISPAELPEVMTLEGPLTVEYLSKSGLMPIEEGPEGLLVATGRLDFEDELASIGFLLSCDMRAILTCPSAIRSRLAAASRSADHSVVATGADLRRLQELANDRPTVRLVNELIADAIVAGASDLHIEASQSGARIRFRVGGALQIKQALTEAQTAAVVSRIKVMANLNISERRHPQDGRLDLTVQGRKIDVRVSTLATQFGESVVLRVLDKARVKLEWGALGFTQQRVGELREILGAPNGIFLVAGPTGSGKTTTLYTALSELNGSDVKIMTVEDPIEYSIEGVNQVQVDSEIGMTFAAALKAILRQDPNIVLVGEIRDRETAEVAVRAALIGRLVLSTIHTNTSVGAIDRLLDLGIEPFLLAATLRGVLSQRLIPPQGGETRSTLATELLRVSPEFSEAINAGVRGTRLAQHAKHLGAVASDAKFA